MGIEIIRDETEVLYESGLRIDPERHYVLLDCDWVLAVRRWLRDDSLFLYYHTEAKTFVLCSWTVPGRVCTEIEVYEEHPAHRVTFRSEREYLTRRTRPLSEHVEQIRRGILERKARERRERMEDAEQKLGAARYLKRKGMDLEAKLLEEGRVPYAGNHRGGERLQQTREELTALAKRA